MKVDAAVIADGERAPNWFRRYRFYTAGVVPRGYDDWARNRLSLGRWIALHLVTQIVGVGLVAVIAAWGNFLDLSGAWPLALVAVLLAPSSAKRCRNTARRTLAGPTARQVLRQIGEPVPPSP